MIVQPHHSPQKRRKRKTRDEWDAYIREVEEKEALEKQQLNSEIHAEKLQYSTKVPRPLCPDVVAESKSFYPTTSDQRDSAVQILKLRSELTDLTVDKTERSTCYSGKIQSNKDEILYKKD